MNKEIEIPEGYEAIIDGNKVIFVEPKESEDERIRKGLIHHLKELREWKVGSMSPIKVREHYDAWISYLEKQKDEAQRQFNLGVQAGREEVLYEQQKEDERQRGGKCFFGTRCIAEGTEAHAEGTGGYAMGIDAHFVSETTKEKDNINEGSNKFTEREQKSSTEETELNSIAFLEQLGYTCIPPEEEQKPAECDKETDIQKAFREGQSAGRQEVFDNPGAYGLEKIDNVFGFKIGDKVRLVDGDGSPHIIKLFEKIEALHGPDFYHVVFEDNAASDHIIPGDEYSKGYFTHMEKIDDQQEQKPIDPSDDELERHQKELHDFKVFAAKQAKEYRISFVHDFEWNNFCEELLSYFNEQKPAEYINITQKILDYIEKNSKKYENKRPVLGDVWAVTKKYTFPNVCNGKPIVEVEKDGFGWMRLPEEVVEVKNGQKKSAEWSEEDDAFLDSILCSIEIADKQMNVHTYENKKQWLLSRFKSLSPQPHTVSVENAAKFGSLEYERGVKDGIQYSENHHWKPSKAQMEAFSQIVQQFKPDKELESLCNDLQKLM